MGTESWVDPTPPAAWKIATARLLARYGPLRVRAVRDTLLRARRARARQARRAAEARGDFRHARAALHGIDRALERWMGHDGGFFVEAGANDGYDQSNTYYFERVRGWHGVLVEPIPALYREAVLERPQATVVNAALVAPDHHEAEVAMTFGGLMSIVAGARGSLEADRAWVKQVSLLGLEQPYDVRVPARTLSSILEEADAPADFDLLSLDVEGFEPQALAGLDLDRHRPRFVLCEVRDRERDRRPIEAVLGQRYEMVEQVSPFDLLYRQT